MKNAKQKKISNASTAPWQPVRGVSEVHYTDKPGQDQLMQPVITYHSAEEKNLILNSKGPWIDINKTSIRHKSVRSMPKCSRFKGLCFGY